MFDDLEYFIRIEHDILKVLHNTLIILKVSKIYDMYILDGFIFIGNE